MSPIAALLMAVLLGSAAQLFFKAGTIGMKIGFGVSLFRIFFAPYLLAGFFCYGVSSLFFLKALGEKPLSWAYPFIALTYPMVLIFSALLFKEDIPISRWFGVFLILLGVIFIGKK